MASNLAIDFSYRYLEASQLREDLEGLSLRLATFDRRQGNPHFFEGRIARPAEFSSVLLALTTIVRTHFFLPRPALLDPVVTSSEDMLRFEGFSGCCGVYVLATFPAEAFGDPIQGRGSTNVDINDAMRAGLSRLRQATEARLSVGSGELAIQANDRRLVEKKVKLPLRWIKAFGEVQSYQARLAPHSLVPGQEFLRLLRSLPKDGARNRPAWIVPAGRGLRLTERETAEGIRFQGTGRLRILESLAAQARNVRIWFDSSSGVSGWELAMDSGRLLVVLSPELFRGFSGEGQVLAALAGEEWQNAIDQVRAQLTWEAHVDVEATAQRCRLGSDEVTAALAVLGTRGLAGFDLNQGRYFHRELPFDVQGLESLHPRLENARQLLAEGKVRVHQRVSENETEVFVAGTDVEHLVRLTPAQDRCTCTWYSKYQGERGPCKHVLAARLLVDGDGDDA